MLEPKFSILEKTVRPSNPNITEGTLAKFDIFVFITLLILPLDAYSSRYIAVETPNTKVTGITIRVKYTEPMITLNIPAFSGNIDNLPVRKLIFNHPILSTPILYSKIINTSNANIKDKENIYLDALLNLILLEILFSSISIL